MTTLTHSLQKTDLDSKLFNGNVVIEYKIKRSLVRFCKPTYTITNITNDVRSLNGHYYSNYDTYPRFELALHGSSCFYNIYYAENSYITIGMGVVYSSREFDYIKALLCMYAENARIYFKKLEKDLKLHKSLLSAFTYVPTRTKYGIDGFNFTLKYESDDFVSIVDIDFPEQQDLPDLYTESMYVAYKTNQDCLHIRIKDRKDLVIYSKTIRTEFKIHVIDLKFLLDKIYSTVENYISIKKDYMNSTQLSLTI